MFSDSITLMEDSTIDVAQKDSIAKMRSELSNKF